MPQCWKFNLFNLRALVDAGQIVTERVPSNLHRQTQHKLIKSMITEKYLSSFVMLNVEGHEV